VFNDDTGGFKFFARCIDISDILGILYLFDLVRLSVLVCVYLQPSHQVYHCGQRFRSLMSLKKHMRICKINRKKNVKKFKTNTKKTKSKEKKKKKKQKKKMKNTRSKRTIVRSWP